MEQGARQTEYRIRTYREAIKKRAEAVAQECGSFTILIWVLGKTPSHYMRALGDPSQPPRLDLDSCSMIIVIFTSAIITTSISTGSNILTNIIRLPSSISTRASSSPCS